MSRHTKIGILIAWVPDGCYWPILLKKSRCDFCPSKSVRDVGIWFAQKTKPSWFLRSDAEIERFLSCRKAALSETDFFNRIGRMLPLPYRSLSISSRFFTRNAEMRVEECVFEE